MLALEQSAEKWPFSAVGRQTSPTMHLGYGPGGGPSRSPFATRRNVYYLPPPEQSILGLSVRSCHYQTSKRDTLKANESISMHTDGARSGLHSKCMKPSIFKSGQTSRSREAKNRFRGLLEAPFSTL